MENNLYQLEVNKLIEVGNFIYKQLGYGCQENVYSEVLELELELRNIPYLRTDGLDTNTRNNGEKFVCFDNILVELDIHSFLSEKRENIFMKSIKDIDSHVGLLLNFGCENLQYIKVAGQCAFQ